MIRPWVGKDAEWLSADLKRTSELLQTDSMEPWREVIRSKAEPQFEDSWAHSEDSLIEGMRRELRGMVAGDRHEQVMADFERQEGDGPSGSGRRSTPSCASAARSSTAVRVGGHGRGRGRRVQTRGAGG